MAKIRWCEIKEEVQEMINTKGADHVCEHFGVTRKHLLTVCRSNGIYVPSRQKRSKGKERQLPNDLPPELIKRRNEVMLMRWV